MLRKARGAAVLGGYGLFLDGAWRRDASGGVLVVSSPATEQVVAEVPAAGRAETEEAIEAAGRGFEAWRRKTGWERADALHAAAGAMARRAEEAALVIATETGKPIAQARREWALAIDQFRWCAEEARRIYGRIVESRIPGGRFEVSREPVGVCAAFTAWNFPAALPARKLAPALAAGCAAILRPSSRTPGTAMVLVDCLAAAGLPPGTVGLVVGATEDTYRPIMESRAVRKVSLTGSTRVGRAMIRDAAETMKRTSMELGGNAPMIVFADADLEGALDVAAPTKYANAGQVCVTPDRFYVHESLYAPFVAGFAARAARLKLGDGRDETVAMGPLIAADRRDEVAAVVEEAVAQGARLVAGGRRPAAFNAGHFFEPTVLAEARDEMRAMAEENFGPVAAIAPFATAEEVYARANASPMGLSAYAFTRSAARAREAAAELKAGMVGINSFALAAAEAPFGGVKFSGTGREGGTEGVEDYQDVKLVQTVALA